MMDGIVSISLYEAGRAGTRSSGMARGIPSGLAPFFNVQASEAFFLGLRYPHVVNRDRD